MVDQTDFFAALQQCSTGERASLRRNCGKLLKDADGQAVVIFTAMFRVPSQPGRRIIGSQPRAFRACGMGIRALFLWNRHWHS